MKSSIKLYIFIAILIFSVDSKANYLNHPSYEEIAKILVEKPIKSSKLWNSGTTLEQCFFNFRELFWSPNRFFSICPSKFRENPTFFMKFHVKKK